MELQVLEVRLAFELGGIENDLQLVSICPNVQEKQMGTCLADSFHPSPERNSNIAAERADSATLFIELSNEISNRMRCMVFVRVGIRLGVLFKVFHCFLSGLGIGDEISFLRDDQGCLFGTFLSKPPPKEDPLARLLPTKRNPPGSRYRL